MRRRLILHRDGASSERIELAGPMAIGGLRGELRPGGEPPALLIGPSAAGALIEAKVPGARAAGRTLEPGKRRLLRPGERFEYLGAAIELEPEPPAEGTRAIAGLLLREAALGDFPVAGDHLVVLEGPQAGLRIPLGPSLTLGRGRAATVRLADPKASRTHARIRATPGAIQLEDLRSKNGVRVNGEPILSGPFPLRYGDEIGIGSTRLALVAAGDAGPPSPIASPCATAPPRVAAGRWPRLSRHLRRPGPTALTLAGAAALLAAATGLGLAAVGI